MRNLSRSKRAALGVLKILFNAFCSILIYGMARQTLIALADLELVDINHISIVFALFNRMRGNPLRLGGG